MADETGVTEEITEETTDEITDTSTDDTADSSADDTESTDETEEAEAAEMTMEEELIADLTVELELSDVKFNAVLLASKVAAAIRDVKRVRNYPSYYTDEQITDDLYGYYPNCRSIALYDYNKIGIDGAASHNENSVSTSFTDRDKLFAGIIPLAR